MDVFRVVPRENLVGGVAELGKRSTRADEVDGVAGGKVELVLGMLFANDAFNGLQQFQKPVD